MKLTLPLLFFLSIAEFSLAQDEPKRIVFKGHIFSEDSIPAENAHLIEYRNLKIISTDSTGRFTVFAYQGDSMMVNHLSLDPLVIHANELPADSNCYYIPTRRYQLPTVFSSELELEYVKKNVQKMNWEIKYTNNHTPPQMPLNYYDNPYDPDHSPGVSFSGLFKLLFKKK
ncbi:hypothetical protein [Sunxiuqinia elliptica]|uniref:CarboxypepD_reg-like domain-containing protein n=1 Tax=Sunxiuqinia elliptica TaxID=655355 RepID=A0A4R6GSR1_9BACT|nr:hypothetical protein [Sunxiuqinia elliptica]TDN98283.1 hypothetical protein DET52_10870 [Sunxiuqinia elliptica]TDO60389.1 hypothetical protein DET65_2193 [Sunxiuqinia elliptica]